MLGNIKEFGDGGNAVRYYGLNRYATDVSENGSNDSQETRGFFERRLDDDAEGGEGTQCKVYFI